MQWNLDYLYPTVKAWEASFDTVNAMVETIPSFQGKLGDFENFKAYYTMQRDLSVTLHTLYQYAALKSDLNKKDVENAARVQKMGAFVAKLSQVSAFERPEVLNLGEKTVLSFIDRDDSLEEYRFPMDQLFHGKDHVLSPSEEGLLANFSELRSSGSELYSSLTIADRDPVEVTLKSGETITVTPGNYRSHLTDLKDPDDRESVFAAFFSYYRTHKNTYASIYKSVLDADVAAMKSRNYETSLDMYLHGKNIDPSVFHNIVAVAKENTDLLKRYYAIRTQVLGLKKHRTFDRFQPLAESTSKYTYEEAKALFFDAVDHLSDDFKDKAKEALKDGFVDVYEQPGKRTGAYSWSAINQHPYILLNYDDTLDSVFTLAHEAGHSMHSLYAAENQPPAIQNYTIFVAEIASTFNEHILLDYFIQNNPGNVDDKIALLQQSIDDIMGTFYRQVLFAAYEFEAHRMAENGEAITHESLSNIMIDLYQHFYDIDLNEEPGSKYEWAYIPHMHHTPYYVYQYATSFAASLKLYDMVKEDPSNIALHKKLLESGGSDWPLNQTLASGIDLTTKEPFLAVVDRLKMLLDALELALQEKNQ